MPLKITLKMQSFHYTLLQITLLGKGKIQTKLCRKYDEGCELFIRVQIFMFLIRSPRFIWDVPLPQYFCVYRHESVCLALPVPSISESCIEIKIKLNFYTLSGIGTGRVKAVIRYNELKVFYWKYTTTARIDHLFWFLIFVICNAFKWQTGC